MGRAFWRTKHIKQGAPRPKPKDDVIRNSTHRQVNDENENKRLAKHGAITTSESNGRKQTETEKKKKKERKKGQTCQPQRKM